jgi:tRNA(Phe) wybutosine-synthesizing methylase Tyw3
MTFKWNDPVIVAAVIGVMLTVSWNVVPFGFSVPTRIEVKQMIEEESPYLKDRKLLIDTLQRNEEKLDKLTAEVEELKIEQAKISQALGHRLFGGN